VTAITGNAIENSLLLSPPKLTS